MPRFHIPSHAWNPDRLALDAAEGHHAVDVLRMKAGDRATVFNGEGSEAEVEIAKAGKHGVELRKRREQIGHHVHAAHAVAAGILIARENLDAGVAFELGVGTGHAINHR